MWMKCVLIITCVLSEQASSSLEPDKRLISDELPTQYQIQRLEAQIKLLKLEEIERRQKLSTLSDQLLKLSIGGCGGVLFEHWGKETCPQSTMLVYSGYAAGSNAGHAGGSSQTLCLPKDPIGGNRATPSAYGIVYGSEYETNFFGPLSSNQDVPCAVCISKPHTAKVLIPGRNKCYNDWHELYHGYLAGNLYTNAGREGYICMAEHPDFIFGGNANSDGRLFYSVISTCGSLPCPPYNESMPLTCVLCGK